MCRKLLIDRVACYGEGIAVVMSGLLFGFLHGNWAQMCYATLIGIFFAYVYLRTGRIIYTIISHMFINGIGIVVTVASGSIDMGYVRKLIFSGKMEEYMLYVQEHYDEIARMGAVSMAAFAIIIAGIILMIVNMKHFYFKEAGEQQLPKGKKFSTVIINPGIICFIIFFATRIVLAQYEFNIVRALVNLFS